MKEYIGNQIPLSSTLKPMEEEVKTKDGRTLYPNSLNNVMQAEYLEYLARQNELTRDILEKKLVLLTETASNDGWLDAFAVLREHGILTDEQVVVIEKKFGIKFDKSETTEQIYAYRAK